MRKSLLSVIFLLSIAMAPSTSMAQCPTPGLTTINTCDFAAGGEITIIFTDGGSSQQNNYILFDTNGPTAVSSPFGSVTKSYNAATQTLVFGNIPDGTYLAANSADGCPALGGTGIVINQTNELILSINSITDDCDNLGSGEIDINITGGDAPFSYAWSAGLPDQEDQTGLSSGSYDVTVTDADNCTFTLNNIQVLAGPNAGTYVGTAGEACTTDTGFDLFTLLDGSQDAGGSWTVASGAGSSVNASTGAVDFTGATAGVFTFDYTVTGTGSCIDDVETVTVNVTDGANAGTYVGTAGEACTTDTGFDLFTLLDGSQDAGGSWAVASGAGSSVNASTGAVDFTGATAGVFTFDYTVTGVAPCIDDVETVTVNLSPAPNAGTYVGTAGEACTTDTGFDLFTLLDGSQDAGGSWAVASGAGSSVNASTGAVDFTGATAGVFTFDYTVTGTGSCIDDVETVTVNVTDGANAGTYVGTAGEACTTDTGFDLFTLLDGSQDAGGSWAVASGAGSSVNASTGAVDFTGATAGVFTFDYTVTGVAPCIDDVETVTVNLSPAPNAGTYVGTAGEACTTDTGFDLFTLLDGSQDAGGSWTVASGAGSSVNASTGAVDFTGATAGVFTFDYTVTGTGSCIDDVETVTVNVTDGANAGTYVGTAGEACTTDTGFDLFTLLDGSQDAGGSWAVASGAGSSVNASTGAVDFTGATAGVFTFDYTVTGVAPCIDDVETVTVNLSPAPNAGTYVGTAGEACTTDTGFDLFTLLDGSQDAGGSWTVASGAGSSVNASTGAVDFTGATAGVFTFDYTVTGTGSCIDDVETVTVNVTDGANAGTYVGTAGEACTTDTGFDLFTLLDGSQDAGGSWAVASGAGSSVNASTGAVDFTGATAGVFTFDYTVTGVAPCIDDVETVTVNLSPAPNAGTYVGTAGEACTTDTGFDLFTLLDGSQDAGGSWTVASGAGSSVNASTGAVDFTGATAGVFTFDYTVTGTGSCIDDVETVTVNVTDGANAGTYVGTAGEACTTDTGFDLFTLLDGSQDAGGSWAVASGAGSSVNASTGAVDFTGATAGVFTFDYTVTGVAPCIDDVETVTVNLSPAPNAGTYVGTAGEACTTDTGFDLFTLLDGSQDAGGSWAVASGAGSSVNASTGAVDFTGATAGVFTFDYTVTGTGSCIDDVETVTVNVTDGANAGTYVGTAGEACTTDTGFDLFTLLDGSQDAGGSWAVASGAGSSVNASTGAVDFTGATAGVFTFDYTVTGVAPCIDDVETVTVNLSPAPNAGTYVGTAGEACTTDTGFDLFTLLDGSQDAGGSWAVASGAGSSVNASTGAVDFTGATAGVFTFDYTVTGTGSCIDDVETVTVNVTDGANAGTYVGTAGEACTTDTGFDLFTLLDGSQDAGGSWAVASGAGSSVNASTGAVDFTGATAGVFTFDYTVTGVAPCIDDVETVTVNLSPAPNAGTYVGTAGEACTTDTGFDLFTLLDGSQDAGGSWAVASGAGSSVNASTGAVDFTGATAGVFTFDYTVTGTGSCIDDVETVTVNVTDGANAGTYVGTAGEACTTDTGFDLFTLLDGSQDAGGSWAVASGAGSSVNASTGAVDFTGATAGVFTFDYTVTGVAPCIDDVETVTVNLSPAPNAGTYVGTAGEACTTDTGFDLFTLLDGSQDAGGSWAVASGAGSSVNASTGAVDFTGATAGVFTFDYTVTGTGSCIDDVETVTVNVTDGANAGTYVGTAGEACTTDTGFDLFTLLDGSQDAGGSWAVASGAGSSVNASTGAVDFTGATAGVFTFDYTVTGVAPCIDDVETVTVNLSPAPNAGTYVGTAGEACTTDTGFDLFTLLDGSQDAGGSWAVASGAGSSVNASTGAVDFTGATAGVFTFDYTVTGTGSCIDDVETVTVNLNSLTVSESITNTSGCGVADGAIDLSITSSSAGDTFVFAWTGPNGFTASTEDINTLEGGDYTVTVTSDLNGCSVSDTYTVVDPVPFTITIDNITNQTACSVNDGSIDLTVTGGTGPFNYYIVDTNTSTEVARTDGDASTTYNFAALAPGDYEVFVEDGACTSSELFTIDPATLVMAIDATADQTACGVNDGSMSLTVSVGTGPFNYYIVDTNTTLEVAGSRSDGDASTTYSFSSLAPGDYEVFVEEGPCTDSETFIINPVAEITASVDSETPADCGGGTNGTITLAITDTGNDYEVIVDGGTPSAVPAGTASFDITGLSLGTYNIVVRDVITNCQVTIVEDVNENATYSIDTEVVTDIATCGGNEGAIDLTISGGTPTFAWTGPSGFTAATEDISALTEAGDYTVTLEEAGCTIIRAYTVAAPTAPTADAGTDVTICLSDVSLSANAASAGEVGTWTVISVPAGANIGDISFDDDNSEVAIASGFNVLGDYVLEWSLDNATTLCQDAAQITITIVEPVSIDVLADDAICSGETFATAATVTGGTSYEWVSSGNGGFDDNTLLNATYTPDQDDIDNGSVQLTLTAFGLGSCIDAVETMTLTIDSLVVNAAITQTTGCGAADGAIDITILSSKVGDTFTINWMDQGGNVFTTEDLSGLTAGSYMVQVTSDLSGCITQETFEIIDPVPFTITVDNTTDQVSCGADEGSINVSVTGSTANLTYYINDDTGTEVTGSRIDNTTDLTYSFSQLAPGDYAVVVEEGSCSASEAFMIGAAPAITASIAPANVVPADCGGGTNGSITVDVVDVGNDFTASITDAANNTTTQNLTAGTTSVLFGGLSQGNYTITIVDDVTTCEFVINQILNENAAFTIDSFVETDIVNCGAAEGAISVTLSGTTGTQSYSWTGPVGSGFTATTEDITGLSFAGDYTLTIVDGGCTVTQIFTVDQPTACDFDCNDLRIRPITEAASCLGVEDGQIFLFLSNVPNSNSFNVYVKGAAQADSEYVAYTLNNPGRGLIVEIEDFFTAGNYNVVVEDLSVACITDILNVNIGTKSNVTANVNVVQPTCTVSTGSINVSLSGTADSFTYELYDAADLATVLASNTTGNFNAVVEGAYVIRFVNANNNGCGVADQTVTIENTAIVGAGAVDISIQQPSCGSSTGTITAVLNNLPSNYDFVLVNGAGDEIARNQTGIFSNVAIGTYVMQFENRVDPNACVISDRGGLVVESINAFNAVASDVENIACFGESTGALILTLDGISVGYYSVDNGSLWNEFTSGNRISGLPAVNNILVSDEPGTSTCEISVPVNITYLSQPIALNGNINLVTQASCTTAELIGEISIPEVTGGVAPYTFFIDANEVILSADRIIGGLSRNVNNLIIEDATGCSESFSISNIVSPNEVRAVVEEINPNENCLDEPEGLRIVIDQNTINTVAGPYNFIINVVGSAETTEFTLDVNVNGSGVFLVGPNEDQTFNFEKGTRYRWTLRSLTNEQACSADNFITINAGAIVPSFDVAGVDAQCFGQSGSIMLSNISADETLPLVIQLFNDRDDIIDTFVESTVPLSGRFIIDQSNFGFVPVGEYNVRLSQKPLSCTDSIVSVYSNIIVDGPTNELFVELVPEPLLSPEVERSRSEMNPVPATRPDFSNGSISIRLVSQTSALSYSAQIFLIEPLAGNNISDYVLPQDPLEFNNDNMLTFDNLLPGIYEIEYYDSFGCGSSGNKLVASTEGGFEITVDYDKSPFIPNIFTPDGDDINDEFEILNLPDNGAEMIITNRNGTIVYRNTSYRPSDLWDGDDQPDGIYFYQLTIDKQVFSGWVEILRDGRSRR